MAARMHPSPRRGRPPRVTIGAILDAAVGLAPGERTFAAIARTLGVSEAAVRYHLPSADRLHVLVCDRLFGALELDAPEATTWTRWLDLLADRLVALRARCPGIERYLIHGPFEAATLRTYNGIIGQVLSRAPGMGRSTAYAVSASVVISVLSDPGADPLDDRDHPRIRERVETISRWRRAALIEGLAAMVDRGEVPQLVPAPDDDLYRAPTPSATERS